MKNDTVPIPSKTTLNKYGLSLDEWQSIWIAQDGLCPICLKPMTRAVVDHFHVKGWKQKPPEERKDYVRGLLCWVCNTRILTRGVTPDKLDRAAAYMRKYQEKWINEHLFEIKDTASEKDSNTIKGPVLP